MPEIRVEEVRKLEKEVSELSEICHVVPKKAKWIVESEVEWLENNKGFLGRLVETGVDSGSKSAIRQTRGAGPQRSENIPPKRRAARPPRNKSSTKEGK